MAEPVGCFKVRLLRHARCYQFELTSVIRGENYLMLALVVPPFSYPHHSPQRLAFFARTNGYALRRFKIEANCMFSIVQNTILQHK
jgi:hypothetical protein